MNRKIAGIAPTLTTPRDPVDALATALVRHLPRFLFVEGSRYELKHTRVSCFSAYIAPKLRLGK
ncbi:hypothetical protein KFK09_015381 [Dendrobium nobile]|uniref:Uncharacterized protein n=1 Tax=Dendrobium nobile TaxID=94219 RepID=A0A8T3B6L7_DENNO|nr:hypothetical protein KFK09_015381 [Dendrobium nobile]